MRFVKFLIAVLVLFLAASFGVKNMQPVKLAYFIGDRTVELPAFFLVLLSVVFGALIACAFFGREHLRLRRRSKRQDRQMIDLQQRLKQCENGPPAAPVETPLESASSPPAFSSDDFSVDADAELPTASQAQEPDKG